MLAITYLKQQVLGLELEPEVRVDDVDEVVDDVAEAAGDHERLPPEDVGPGSGKYRDDNPRPALHFRNTLSMVYMRQSTWDISIFENYTVFLYHIECMKNHLLN